MPLEFTRNTLLKRPSDTEAQKITSICYVFADTDEVALVERTSGYIRRPAILSHSQLRQKINRGTYEFHEEFNEKLTALDDDGFTETEKNIRDKRYQQIQPIVTNTAALERYLRGGSQVHILEQIVETHRVSLKHLYHLIHRYLAFGGVKNALLPHYHACGGSSSLPLSEKRPGPKRGRPAIYSKLNTRNWTQADSDFVKNEFWPNLKSRSYKSDLDLYDEFCNQRFGGVSATTESGKSNSSKNTRRKKEVSFEQFQYHLPSCIPFDSRYLGEKGPASYENNAKAVSGSARHHVRGPGDLYQIDATTASVNLLYSKCDIERISCGRPTLYVVIDVYTTMIVGFYVSLGAPKWDLVGEALYNAFMPKDEFLKEFRCSQIKAKDWPCFGVPKRLGMDRDPAHSSQNLEAMLKAKFGIDEAEVYPAYRGSAKGINERAVGRIEAKNKRLRGARNENTPIDKPHPSNDALYTYRDYVRAVAREVIAHNKRSFKPWLLNEDTVKRAKGASPLEMWNLSYDKHMGRRPQPSPDHIRFSLLRESTATVTKEGILVRDRLYKNKALQKMETYARNVGVDKIKIRSTSMTVNYIWYKDDNDVIYRCDLSEKSSAYRDATEMESGMLHEDLKHMRGESQKRERIGRQQDYAEQQAEEKAMKERRKKLKPPAGSRPDKAIKKAREEEQKIEQAHAEEQLKTVGESNASDTNLGEVSDTATDSFEAGKKRMQQVLENRKKKQ